MLPRPAPIKPWLPWTILAMIALVVTVRGLADAGWEYSANGRGDLERICLSLALAVAGIVIGIFALQQRRRIRWPNPSCCRRCGYDLRGTPGSVCSECGEPVRSCRRLLSRS